MIRLFSLLSLLLVSVQSHAQEPPRWGIPPNERLTKTLTAMEVAQDEDVRDWSLDSLSVPEVWKRSRGKNVVVAVLDTGVYKDHRDLKKQLLSTKNYTRDPDGKDPNGHGTWCVGAIVAEQNNWGMIGVAPDAKCISYKVLDDAGSGSVVNIAKAIRDATDDGCDVISMSLGGPSADQWIPPALKYARSKGVVIIAAAGNEGPAANTVGFPGGYPECIAVGATDSANTVADFSSRGPAVFVVAPGVQTRSTYPGPGDGRFATISGTSMATPRVAGLAALWIAANPQIPKAERPAKFAEALRLSCKFSNQRSAIRGYGKPDATKLLPEVADPTPPTNPSANPGVVVITEASLLDSERAKLKAIGVERFSIQFGVNAQPKITTKKLMFDPFSRMFLLVDGE